MPSYSAIVAADADESIAITSSAGELTLPTVFSVAARQTRGVTGGRVTILVRTAAILWTINGTAPTAGDASTGDLLNVGDRLVLTTFPEMDNLKMRPATATDGAAFAVYQRRIN